MENHLLIAYTWSAGNIGDIGEGFFVINIENSSIGPGGI